MNSLSIIVKDNSGNYNNGNISVPVSITTTNPVVSANYKTGTYSSSIKVKLTTNKGTIYYKIGNGAYKKYSTQLTISSTSKLSFYAVDSFKQKSSVKTLTYTINKKSTPKKAKITYSVKVTTQGKNVKRVFTIKNSGNIKGSASTKLKVPAGLTLVKVTTSKAYYSYKSATKTLTFGVKNLNPNAVAKVTVSFREK
ncbi:chitobiase/beta-hexosaminidase C-terminal domain-containing protein [Methanobrevibacter curvatus]|uniref:GH29D-like beta-sandwich domain-containing protein n=1 Tax=Methanobrevibacter curvatus TaxID=49547 RepID=A0A166CNJ1_9EURY|nr:chitobiase/beta-hexosaminidase C-terminal domain-containing protein [Methanobrevibacter curvatus]KZX15657.1 hypothetical protein MBCUR_02100 [Methanobrevibacter curvatus]